MTTDRLPYAATGNMGADFPFEVYHNADDHADECGYNDARHIAWQMNLVHRKQAGYIADNG